MTTRRSQDVLISQQFPRVHLDRTRKQKHLPCFHFSPLPFSPTGSFSFLVWTSMLSWLVALLAHIPWLLERFLPTGVFATCSRTFTRSLAGSLPVWYSPTNDRALVYGFDGEDVPCDRDGQTSSQLWKLYYGNTRQSERKLEGEKEGKKKLPPHALDKCTQNKARRVTSCPRRGGKKKNSFLFFFSTSLRL